MKLTARRTPSAVHLCDEAGTEQYRLSRRPFRRGTMLCELASGRIFYIKQREQPHPWNREGEVLCTLTDAQGGQVLSGRIRFEKESMPPAPFRHGELRMTLPGYEIVVKRTGQAVFRLTRQGCPAGLLDCGSYRRQGLAEGPDDGLTLAALFGWCPLFQQADCRITV